MINNIHFQTIYFPLRMIKSLAKPLQCLGRDGNNWMHTVTSLTVIHWIELQHVIITICNNWAQWPSTYLEQLLLILCCALKHLHSRVFYLRCVLVIPACFSIVTVQLARGLRLLESAPKLCCIWIENYYADFDTKEEDVWSVKVQ